MYDLALLKLFLNEEHYRKYRDHVDKSYFSEPVLPLLNVIDAWRTEHDGDLTVEDLNNLLFAKKPLEYEANKLLLDNLTQIQNTETVHEAVNSLVTAQRLKDLALVAFEASRGRKSIEDVLTLSEALALGVGNDVTESFQFISDDLEDLLNESFKGEGLQWRLDILNKSLGPLRKGDFGFLFARPETGKTTFLSSEATYMAENLPDDAGPIIWFNNEEQGSKVKMKLYQSTLGVRLGDLVQSPKMYTRAYKEKIRGKLLLYDGAIIHRKTVESIIKEHQPSLVIFDQIDKIAGFKNDRPDLQLGEIYIWARGLAKEWCPVIGVCQADGTGEGRRYLTMANVANAKTAKQAEADWILGIGKDADDTYDGLRFFNVLKNKLLGGEDTDEKLRHLRAEVKFFPEIGRYEDM